jgi:putative FmdB family regulatory protein
MPIYEYRCACGATFDELHRGFDEPAPACPSCSGVAERVQSRFSIVGVAKTPRSADDAPCSWRETGNGNRAYIQQWRRELDRRAVLEDRHPELAPTRTPVLSHESCAGIVPAKPLPSPSAAMAQTSAVATAKGPA